MKLSHSSLITKRKSSNTFFLLLIIFFCGLLFSCNSDSAAANEDKSSSGNGSEISANIKVKVNGFTSGQAGLIATFGDQNYKIDTASIDVQGRFEFKKPDGYPFGSYFVILPDKNYFQILIDKDQKFELETTASDLVNGMKVNGSTENAALYESLTYEQSTNPRLSEVTQKMVGLDPNSTEYSTLKKSQDQLMNERKEHLNNLFKKYPNTLFTSFKRAGQNPDIKEVYFSDGTKNTQAQIRLYREEFWDGVDINDDRLMQTPVIYNKLNRYITELTPQQPDSLKKSIATLIDRAPLNSEIFKFFVNWIALKYEPTKTTLMDSEAIYVFMVENYITKEKAFWADAAQIQGLQLRASEMANSLIGQKGPDVNAPSTDGSLKSIYDISSPYIVVYLYNPDCDHCQEETPKLVDFYRQWKPRGLEVFAIAIDTDDTQWKNFIRENNMDWINVFDPTNKSIYAKYYVDNTPEIYVLNPERKIIAKNLKVHQIETMINRDMAN